MDSSLQFSVVSSDRLVASNSHWDGEVGGHNIGLNSGGVGLVGDFLGGWNNGMGIGDTSIGMWVSAIDHRSHNSSISIPLTIVVAIQTMAIQTISISMAIISMAISKTISTIQQVGVSISISISRPLAIVTIGRDSDGVLLDNGLPNSVGDHSTGAHSEGSLASLIHLGVQSRGSEQSRNFMDSSLQFSVVSSDRLVASNSHWD